MQQWTWRLTSSRSEGAPHAAQHESHLVLGKIEAGCDLPTVDVQPLRRDVQLDAAVGTRDGQAGFGAHERLVLHADLVAALDGDVAHHGRVAVTQLDGPEHVAVGMDRSCDERHLRIDDGVELLIDHDDRFDRHLGDFGVLGGDRGDGLAVVAHDVAGEHRLVHVFEPVGRGAGHVLGGDHGVHAGDGERRTDVDRNDARRGVRRSERATPDHAVSGQVRGELEGAEDLGDAVGADRALPHPRRS